MQKRDPVIYLAGPYGFTEIGRSGIQEIKRFLNQYGEIIDPFELNASIGKRINEITIEFSSKSITQFKDLNRQIAINNCHAIQRCDIMFAILDGSDIDSGTAAEIGYAFGLEKLIFGYRSDFRIAGDNPGACVNLQIEYFIRTQGGSIFRSLSDLYSELPKYIEHWQSHHNSC
jgi:nucleoside 2-deoxyribosyltransferase